eukprot:m.61748 g.61748  ORF g.61748 m.61748 type:complete len:757 (-) comp13355_c3_seq1:92-2362(-)
MDDKDTAKPLRKQRVKGTKPQAKASSPTPPPGLTERQLTAWFKKQNAKRASLDNVFKRNKRGETELHRAAITDDAEYAKELLEHGAPLEAKDYAGWTALHEACNHGHVRTVEVLLKANANVNAKGLDDITPLHDAVMNGHTEVARLLVAYGADILSKNKQGETPIDLAVDDPELHEYLLAVLEESQSDGATLQHSLTWAHAGDTRARASRAGQQQHHKKTTDASEPSISTLDEDLKQGNGLEATDFLTSTTDATISPSTPSPPSPSTPVASSTTFTPPRSERSGASTSDDSDGLERKKAKRLSDSDSVASSPSSTLSAKSKLVLNSPALISQQVSASPRTMLRSPEPTDHKVATPSKQLPVKRALAQQREQMHRSQRSAAPRSLANTLKKVANKQLLQGYGKPAKPSSKSETVREKTTATSARVSEEVASPTRSQPTPKRKDSVPEVVRNDAKNTESKTTISENRIAVEPFTEAEEPSTMTTMEDAEDVHDEAFDADMHRDQEEEDQDEDDGDDASDREPSSDDMGGYLQQQEHEELPEEEVSSFFSGVSRVFLKTKDLIKRSIQSIHARATARQPTIPPAYVLEVFPDAAKEFFIYNPTISITAATKKTLELDDIPQGLDENLHSRYKQQIAERNGLRLTYAGQVDRYRMAFENDIVRVLDIAHRYEHDGRAPTTLHTAIQWEEKGNSRRVDLPATLKAIVRDHQEVVDKCFIHNQTKANALNGVQLMGWPAKFAFLVKHITLAHFSLTNPTAAP